MKRKHVASMLLLSALACSAPTHAQSAGDGFPSRPLRMIVPLSPGTTTDIVARMLAERMALHLGQPVAVENRQGAGGVIAAQAALAAAPDGYTFLMVNSQHVINPAVHQSLPYDTLRDFVGIALVAEAPSVVVVTPKLGVRSLKEFIALAKQQPDAINYASSGIGSQTHLAGAYFANQAGISIVHVPYKTSSEVVADLLAGRVQATFVPAAFLLGPIRDGKLLALAVTTRSAMRAPLAAPSVSDEAIPGFEYATWFGFVVPAKVPAQAVERLARAIQSAGAEDEVKAKLQAQGIAPRTLGPREFDAYMKADMDRLAPVVKAAGVTAK
jgi:tripartite-type tricarboxylate transporter receptor subunit TctC